MADLFENIAPSWVTNHLYQLGDVVLYNKKLYQCTDKHTSSSEIDLDKFKSHTLADMVAGTTQLENFADMTVVSDVVTNDDTYTYLEMPNNGVVSDKTKIATLTSNLGNKYAIVSNVISGAFLNNAGSSANSISYQIANSGKMRVDFNISWSNSNYSVSGFNSISYILNGITKQVPLTYVNNQSASASIYIDIIEGQSIYFNTNSWASSGVSSYNTTINYAIYNKLS